MELARGDSAIETPCLSPSILHYEMFDGYLGAVLLELLVGKQTDLVDASTDCPISCRISILLVI